MENMIAKGGSAKALTMRLLKVGMAVDDAIREGKKVTERRSKNGRMFIDQSKETPPDWLNFLNEFAEDGPIKLVNRSCSAVLFLEISQDAPDAPKRAFALSFGGGHHMLQPDAFERDFGLRVTLNAVARRNLKNVDVATLESTSFQKRIQASRKADLQGFGIDFQKDLLRLAGGVPTDTSFARSLAGRDALTLTKTVTPADAKNKCGEALRLFKGNEYKKDYSFIDFIVPVREKKLIGKLDGQVFDEIKALIAGEVSDLHLIIPEVIDPEATFEIGYFGLGFRPGAKATYGELAIEDYIRELAEGHPDDVATIDDLKASHEIRLVVDGQGDKKRKQRVYDCFVYETSYGDQRYVLFSGEWYCIDSKFFEDVEASFRALVSGTSGLKTSTNAENEKGLIAELDEDKDLLMLDTVKIAPHGAAGANLEPCDFFSRNKEFIHLKDGHGSAPISHLWSQGVVSAESFVRDETFRKRMRSSAIQRQRITGKAGFEALLPDGRSKPVPSDYRVVYGIMRHRHKRSGKLDLPFFSKVSLQAAASRIQLMGFEAEVVLIEKR